MKHQGYWRVAVAAALVGLLAACGGTKGTVTPTEARYRVVSFDAVEGWDHDGRMGEALGAFQRSCKAWTKRSPSKMLGKGMMRVQAGVWQDICADALAMNTANHEHARAFFESHFVPMSVEPMPDNGGLVTGYYEPLLFGSRTCGGRYSTPLYRLPPDRREGVPYYERRSIDEGVLQGRGLEILCVDDPVGAFFLEIQGSGRVALAEGGMVQLGYAGQNGHPFVPIGRVLRERGLIPKGKVTLFSIREYLKQHPREAREVMWQNPSYVFFKENTGAGPIGAQGIPLTPQRSLAVDPRFAPYGAPIFLDTTLPPPVGGRFARLMVAQDTGGAIKGPARADLFFGFEPPAELLAGGMKQNGTFTVLLPRQLAESLDGEIVE